ncbi:MULTISPECIES: alanine racemase [Sporosarcina]|uniref:alanine racemase n=1 Tax=Sporosarcina TaxID=1569 RepID=UPI00129BBF51|nr:MULTISPECIES: alanine racemase [Sporosarcina]GKV67213.1 alanine racemase 1 [Sporosarcina sp. NCCP-2331]GLB57569.1 alanine racemase 1 [Sporosarcina sp. NCCP-2378]
MYDNTDYRPTRAIINIEAIQHNAQQVTSYLPNETKLIAVVKADGYGHGAAEVSSAALAAGAEMLAVATPDEALALRKQVPHADILVLGPSPVSFVNAAAEHNITITVTSKVWAEQAGALRLFDKKCKVHVKIDSGMGRIGVRTEQELARLIELINQSGNFSIDGAFTHFARADEKETVPTDLQFKKFMKLVDVFPRKPRLVHASNSAGALIFPEYSLDAVRFGISLYGIAPSALVAEKMPFALQRAMTLETELSFVKKLPAGEEISYGGKYITSENDWIGTLPIGYADGLKRALTGQEVLVGGKRAPIVGAICMDQCMVKLPQKFPEGEKVTLLGKQGDQEITMEEWAERLGTIPYEIAVTLSERIPRVYK